MANAEAPVMSSDDVGQAVVAGVRDVLLQGERQRFLAQEWPKVHATIQRLGLKPEELLDVASDGTKSPTTSKER